MSVTVKRFVLFAFILSFLAASFFGGLVFFLILLIGGSPVPAALGEPSDRALNEIPRAYLDIYREAGERYGIPWNVLAAIHKRETGFGPTTKPGDPRRKHMISSSGAVGPFQFLPATWRSYGVDGNGDGTADPWDVEDAVHSAAKYLRDHGGRTDLRGALWHYNHTSWYVEEVLQIADGYLNRAASFPQSGTSGFLWPVPGTGPGNVSSGFGFRIHPIDKTRRFHGGIDIPSQMGRPVVAAIDGTVIFTGNMGGYGRTVVLDAGNGIQMLYGHLSRIEVRRGKSVKRGETIGKVGSTGYSTGPHLHFTIKVNHEPVDPMKFFRVPTYVQE